MSQKRINPRRRPATEADLEWARQDAISETLKHSLQIMLFVLLDKHGATYEELETLAAEFNEVCGDISSGLIKWRDVESVLREEFDVEAVLK